MKKSPSAVSSALSVLLATGSACAYAQAGDTAVTLQQVEVKDTEVSDEAPALTLDTVFADQPSVGVGGPTASSQKVFVNGIEENNLNVQIDGARQSNNIWHHNGSTLIDPQILKAATVDAGVAPADAGPGALGGSIRYETRDVADLLADGDHIGAFIGAGYETNGETFSQSAAAYGRGGAFEALAYASHGEGKNYEDGSGNEVLGTGVNLLSTLGKLAYNGMGGHRVELSGQYLIDDDVRPLRANFADVGGRRQYASNEFKRHSATLEYGNTRPTSSFDPTVRLYVNESSIYRPSPTGGFARIYFDSSVRSVGGLAQNRFVTPWGQLTAGADFYEDRSETDNFRDPLYSETATNFGAFAQLRTDASKPLSTSLGLRVDSQQYDTVEGEELDNTGVSPNLSLRYAFTPSLALSAGYSYVFGGLQLLEAALFHASPYTYADDVDVQRSRNAKLGLEYHASALTLGVEGFDTLIDNSPDVDIEPGVRHNGPDLETRGFNLNAGYDWMHARLSAVYTHADLDYGDAGIRTFAPTFGTPIGDILKITGLYAWPGAGLNAGIGSEIALDYDHDDNAETPDLSGYELINAHVEWKPTGLRALSLRVAASNLLDKDYVDRFTTQNAENTAILPLLNPGRSFTLSTRWVF